MPFLALAAAALLGAPASLEGPVSFTNDVQAVLTKAGCNSGACHGAAAGKNGFKLSLRGYDPAWDHAVLTRQAGGRRVDRRRPDESLILKKALQEIPHGGGRRFEPGSIEHSIVRGWVAAGAPGPREGEVRIESIEVEPGEAVVAKASKVELRVRAKYTDGSTRDVTRWVKYGTTQDSVATVDESGVATVIGSGEAAITAWFQSKVAFSRVISPFPAAVPDNAYADAERRGFIDDLVLVKLKKLNLAPAALSGDLEFLRRACLDAAGILPTADEALRFEADADPEKRAKAVDRLLERPELADYWAYKWSDLLLVSSRKIAGDSLTSFYEFIRRSVAENKPWDVMAREIVTATGSTVENGAAGYYLIHKDPTDLVETTSQAFLGMSITCARCHNHPLEKWTQDQYYGMANLFARVSLKQGERDGEVFVLPASQGEILHPRIGRPMPPCPLDGVPLEDPAGDRRAYLAAWLTSPENPYFARALVSRVWKNFFGRGLVEPEDDLRLLNPSSNEPLFRAVVKDFVDHRFDVKHLIRTILLSATYQRSSAPASGGEPDDVFYSRYIPRRLPAEVVLDAYSAVTGVPTPFPGYPAGFRALQLRDSQVRSYFLKAFGRPDRNTTCACERTDSSSLAQVLHVANGETLDDKLRAKEGVISRWIERKLTDEQVLDELYLAALTRRPTPAESASALKLLAEGKTAGGEPPGARRAVLEDLVWSVLSGKEFLFNK